jgi:hypothetical protein
MAAAEQGRREAELRPDEAPQVNVAGIEETATDKGYHSGAVVKRMKAYGVRTYIPEKKQKGRRNWAGKAKNSKRCMPTGGGCGASTARVYCGAVSWWSGASRTATRRAGVAICAEGKTF